jgi:hypothetical protein
MSGKDAIHSFLDHANGQKLTPIVTLLLGGAVVGSMSNVYPLYIAAAAAFFGGLIACAIYIADPIWRFVSAVGWCGVMVLFWVFYFSPTIHENEKQAKQLADAIANISGGDSYVEIVPEGHETISYAIFSVGHSILSNVSITVVSNFGPGIQSAELYTVDVGTLAPVDTPNFMRFVPLPIIPEKSPYELFINAPNGTTIEVIQFRKGPCGSWSTRYKIQPPAQPNRPIKGYTEWEDEKC